MPRSVLVVEDYPDLRAAIVDVLSQNDCICETTTSDDAIAKLAANHYETIFLAPKLSIRADPVLSYLALHQPGELMHVVVMTNPSPDDDAPDARCHVLQKPFGRDELMMQLNATR